MPAAPQESGAFARLSEEEGRPRSTPEAISDTLRERIMVGEFKDGDALPSQAELSSVFSVSKPSVREALRILEIEGLVRVRRGRFGGALVNAPRIDHAARTIELILRSRKVRLEDIANALVNLEPICAAMCARRPDRDTEVVPVLRQALRQCERVFDDPVAFAKSARDFHELVVSCSGNETIAVLVGAVEAMWSAYGSSQGVSMQEAPVNDAVVRTRSFLHHGHLVDLIAAGDEEAAMREARNHLISLPRYATNVVAATDGSDASLERFAPEEKK